MPGKSFAICVAICSFTLSTALEAQEESAKESPIEATSLFGEPLRRMEFDAERLAKLTADLEAAQQESESDPDDPHKLIWVGRRLGYLWRYNEAIEVFTKGIEAHPDVPHLYRHRGHRYITIRKFDLAIGDLEKAAKLIEGTKDEVEQDGMPNAAGIPTSTLHTNIWYHLGLAYYLKGDFRQANRAFGKCYSLSDNDDMRVATVDWYYMTYCRLQPRGDDVSRSMIMEFMAHKHIIINEMVQTDMNILENHAYHRRLLMYKGKLQISDLLPDENSDSYDLDLATYGYGIGNWYLRNRDADKALETFQKVTAGKYWSAFGFIAAEADLFRLQEGK